MADVGLVRRSAVALLVAAAVGACSSAPGGSGGPSDGPSGSPRPTDPAGSPRPDALLLRVSAEGGFVPPGYIVTRLPQLSVYEDGRVIEPGAVPAIYPGPAVNPLVVHRLGRDAIEGIRAAARGAGLAGPDRSYSSAAVADVETTVLTYWDADGAHRLSIYALGFDPAPGTSDEERAARLAAATLIRQVHAYVDPVPTEAYAPTAHRIYASRATGPSGGEPAPNVLDWPAGLPPLASLPASSFPPGAGCAVIQGDALAPFAALLRSASAITRYREAGTEWTLAVRPLLPDESRSCSG